MSLDHLTARGCAKLWGRSHKAQIEFSSSDRIVPQLELISDDYGRALMFRSVRIATSPAQCPPFPVDAIVMEEDTNLLMSTRAEIRAPAESFGKLVDDMASFEPAKPGSVIVHGRAPVHLMAIVHDIECTPTWREEWVALALSNVILETERQRLASLCLPVLGSRHGTIATATFAKLLREVLETRTPERLRRIWAVVSEQDTGTLLDAFR